MRSNTALSREVYRVSGLLQRQFASFAHHLGFLKLQVIEQGQLGYLPHQLQGGLQGSLTSGQV